MKKISSRMTFWYKRVLPALLFGFMTFFFLGIAISVFTGPENDAPVLLFLIVPIIMAAIGYFVMKKLVFDLIDEVWDEGDSLLFRNGGREVRIRLTDIRNVSYSIMNNPQRVTLSLRSRTDLGTELTFCPPISLIPFKKHSIIVQLIDRIDQARRQPSDGNTRGEPDAEGEGRPGH